jgi:serine/threonine protein kinase
MIHTTHPSSSSFRILGEGSFGCIRSPAFSCAGTNEDDSATNPHLISKLIDLDEAEKELKEAEGIAAVDPDQNFTISKLSMCKPKENEQLVREYMDHCETMKKNFPVKKGYHLENPQFVAEHFVLLRMENGGMSLHDWINIFTNNAITRHFDVPTFFRSIPALLRGLQTLHEAKLLHMDLNPKNIVYNPQTQKLKLIDFGKTRSRVRIWNRYADPKYDDKYHAYWEYYPIESFFMQYNKFTDPILHTFMDHHVETSNFDPQNAMHTLDDLLLIMYKFADMDPTTFQVQYRQDRAQEYEKTDNIPKAFRIHREKFVEILFSTERERDRFHYEFLLFLKKVVDECYLKTLPEIHAIYKRYLHMFLDKYDLYGVGHSLLRLFGPLKNHVTPGSLRWPWAYDILQTCFARMCHPNLEERTQIDDVVREYELALHSAQWAAEAESRAEEEIQRQYQSNKKPVARRWTQRVYRWLRGEPNTKTQKKGGRRWRKLRRRDLQTRTSRSAKQKRKSQRK